MTPYKKHLQTWNDCTKCELSSRRSKMVFTRGTLPCHVLFVGEAPGESENVIGKPFIGPAGKLLDKIIERSVPQDVTYALTNLVCCIPYGEDGHKTAEPDDEHIEACAPRLQEFSAIAKPKLLVCVGALADRWIGVESHGYKHRIKLHEDIPTVTITHPAAVLRASIAQRGLMIQRMMVLLANAIEDHITNPTTQKS